MLTLEELKYNLDYNSDAGVFTRLVSNTGAVKVGDVAGWVQPNGYTYIRVLSKAYLAHRLAWFYVNGVWPSDEIDHIDGVRGNNAILNLRECDKFQNQCNTLPRKDSLCKSKGVDFMKLKGKFRARIRVRGKDIHLGIFDTEEEASLSYQVASKKYQEGFGTTRSSENKDLK